jgi:hypothetical protein
LAIVTISADFAGKIARSLVENPNTVKLNISGDVEPLSPLSVMWTETSQTNYNGIVADDSSYLYTDLRSYPQYKANFLISFDVIRTLEKQYGAEIWKGKTLLSEKIEIAKSSITTFLCRVLAQAMGTNKTVYLTVFDGQRYVEPKISAITNSLTWLQYSAPSDYITDDGYIHFLFQNSLGTGQYLYIDTARLDLNVQEGSPPETPTNLTVTAEVGKIKVAWAEAANAIEYTIQRRTDGEAFTTIGNTSDLEFIDEMDKLSTETFYYRVNAVNELGSSEFSPEVSAAAIPEYIEHNVFVPSYYWNGDEINDEGRQKLIEIYALNKRQTITSQCPFVCIRSYNYN